MVWKSTPWVVGQSGWTLPRLNHGTCFSGYPSLILMISLTYLTLVTVHWHYSRELDTITSVHILVAIKKMHAIPMWCRISIMMLSYLIGLSSTLGTLAKHPKLMGMSSSLYVKARLSSKISNNSHLPSSLSSYRKTNGMLVSMEWWLDGHSTLVQVPTKKAVSLKVKVMKYIGLFVIVVSIKPTSLVGNLKKKT
jgi:hypothetical protein